MCVFVTSKSSEKCALTLNMQAFNQDCAFKFRPCRLPTLEGLAMLSMLIRLNKIPQTSFMAAFATSLLCILDPNNNSNQD